MPPQVKLTNQATHSVIPAIWHRNIAHSTGIVAWLLEEEVAEVVRVKKHGEPHAVILSYELFEVMRRNNRTALRADELSNEDLEAIRNSSPLEEFHKYDDELDK